MTHSSFGCALILLAVCFASGCERGSRGAPDGVVSTAEALQADTSTALASSNNPSDLGAAVTLTATVSPSSPDAGVPTGTVAFTEGDAPLGIGNLDGSGVATLTTSTLGLGQHTLGATYGGDTNFNVSTSTDFVQTVSPDGATLALTSSGSPSVFNGNVTFSARVSSGVAGSTPTGTVTFKEGANTLGTGDLDGTGVALYSTNSLTGGNHTVSAVYDGDPNHAAASGSFNQIVAPAATTTTLKSNTNPSLPGEAVVFTATVLGSGAAPVGSVTFTEGALMLGSSPLVDSGIALLAVSTLAPGPHAISASFAGDLNFRASASSGFVQQVTVTEFGAPDTDAAGAAGASGSAGAAGANSNSNDNAGADSGGAAGALGSSPQGDAGQSATRDPVGSTPSDPGCGCRSTPRAPASGGALLWGLAALVAVRRSRAKTRQ
ncbi:MAG: Ig-like domain-containing protein [Polyangiaceae bacterium]